MYKKLYDRLLQQINLIKISQFITVKKNKYEYIFCHKKNEIYQVLLKLHIQLNNIL